MNHFKQGYQECPTHCGETIDEVHRNFITRFKNNRFGEKFYVEFNGKFFYSDDKDLSLDRWYLEITGLTKNEFQEKLQQIQQSRLQEQKQWESYWPTLVYEYIEKGEKLLPSSCHELWKKYVKESLPSLYRNLIIDALLDLIEKLNAGASIEEVYQYTFKQGHSGASAGITFHLLAKLLPNKGKLLLKRYYEGKKS